MKKAEKLSIFLKSTKETFMWRECWACIDLLCHNIENMSDKEIEEIFIKN